MARSKKAGPVVLPAEEPLLAAAAIPPPPDFLELLRKPLVKLPLPTDFSEPAEAEHLSNLWAASKKLRSYKFETFVHAGGSGLVFKVQQENVTTPLSIKIARRKLYLREVTNPEAAQNLSPLTEQELRALQRLTHSNIVRFYDTIADQDKRIFAIITSFVSNPVPLDQFLRDTLGKDPSRKRGIQPFAPQRLDDACAFLVERFQEIINAVEYMHSQSFYHCDLKPANILIETPSQHLAGRPIAHHAILTDLGSCVHTDDADEDGRIQIQFTWTYAHPELRDMINDPHGISGGGLKASAKPVIVDGLARFDLFALGRTLQETLADLEREFGERCYATYNFRFLHLIAALLLDGRNAPTTKKVTIKDGKRFIRDLALDYPAELFGRKKFTSAQQVGERLKRFSRSYWPAGTLPELDLWNPDVINTGIDTVAPFSPRVAEIFRHPAVRRLRSELQLGWVKEVYPGATHTRWSHSLGVFATAAEYYSALLCDPEVPSTRVMLSPVDIEHGLVAAILHDLGQIGFGHDFEAAAPQFYDHEALVMRLLDDTSWGGPTLREAIKKYWPRVEIPRVLAILEYSKAEDSIGEEQEKHGELMDPVDGIARDIISGPIDADKLDYLTRDSASCRVPYGLGIDRPRFMRAITVSSKEVLGKPRLALAYRAKGAAAVESLLLARYQMYGAVYWHHTFRCIQAMFSLAVVSIFRTLNGPEVTIRGQQTEFAALRDFFYLRVVCGHPLRICRENLRGRKLGASFFEGPPSELVGERALEFLWKCADDQIRELIMKLARRELFRRVFEVQLGDLGGQTEYSDLRNALKVEHRISICARLKKAFMDAIYKEIQQKGKIESVSENAARKRYTLIAKEDTPLIAVDFPMRGIQNDRNFPRSISDAARKYISGRSERISSRQDVFQTVRKLQMSITTVRIFASRELHELIVRYLEPLDVQQCVESVIPILKVHK